MTCCGVVMVRLVGGTRARLRPGRHDQEAGPGVRRFAAEPGHPAQSPQRDRGDRYAVVAGHQRMRELVGEERGEEGHRAGDGHRPIRDRELLRCQAREDLGAQEPADQDDHDQDAPVRADADARHPAQRHGLLHRRAASGARSRSAHHIR